MPPSSVSEISSLSCSQKNQTGYPPHLPPEPKTGPILEIVTNKDAMSVVAKDGASEDNVCASHNVARPIVGETSMIVHSSLLSKMIKGVVRFYPR